METLARAGFPSLNRWSADTVGRIAYALAVGSVTWVMAAGNILLDRPKNLVEVIVRGGGALLLTILPFVLARLAIPKNRSPLFADAGRQQMISIAGGIFGIVAIQTMMVVLTHAVDPPLGYGYDIIALAGVMLVLGVIVLAPLAPIVHYANDIPVGEDHAPRMRWRIGAALAANMIGRALLFFILIGIPSQYMDPEECLIFGSAYLVPAFIFAIALYDIGNSVYVLARTKSWIARVRAGKVAGVRVRDGDGEELTAVPQLLHVSPSRDIALVETVPQVATYRAAPLPIALGIVSAR